MKLFIFFIRFTAILLSAALAATNSSAQTDSSTEFISTPQAEVVPSEMDTVENQLKPADTSSPRDTLRSFLTDIKIVIEAWQKNQTSSDQISYRAYERALSTLDFSTTPDSDSRMVMNQRILMLQEILARIDLPPDKKIPGDKDVASSGLDQWKIPGTSLTIKRLEHGPRAGEFLFSAATVQRLPQYYQMVKRLPYKSDATSGFYEAYLNLKSSTDFREQAVRNRLKPVNTSSPRSTLGGFIDSVNRAYALVKQANVTLKDTAPMNTGDKARDIEITALNFLERAVFTLDLSKVPEALRHEVGTESVLLLKEILDRMYLPPIDAVPNMEMVSAERVRLNRTAVGNTWPVRWKYPNTEIEIVEIMEGENQGKFLFSANTVNRLKQFYEKVRDLPYRKDYERIALEYGSLSETSKGLYEYYVSTPGSLIPQASLLGRLVENLPGWFKTVYGDQTAWQWIALFLCVLATAVLGYGVFRVVRLLAGQLKPPLDHWLMILAIAFVAIIVLLVIRLITNELSLTGAVLAVAITVGQTIVAVLAIWAVFRLCRAVAETIIASPRIPDTSVDASLLRIAARIVGFLLGGFIFIKALRELGADLIPLLAGLGVGGLAVALAAQRTLANFIGSLILFANKPVKVGDFCRYGDQIGTVEKIGLLATRIRSLERTVVTVPNAEFSEMQLDNFTKRDQRLLKTVLQLRYETTPEQMRYVLAKMREMLLGHPKVTPAPARVRFVGYGAFSKDVEIFAYLYCQDQDIFLAIQEDILLRIEDIVNEAGSGFAFPSQTAYLTRDKGLDRERKGQAEALVQKWRNRGKLPFPEFEESESDKFKDILDYPPKGSPHYEPPKASLYKPLEPPSSRFAEDDLLDLPSLTAKLQESNQLTDYLRGRLSAETRKLLSNYGGGLDTKLREALVQDLNAMVLGPAIYDADRFSNVELRPETQELLDRSPQGEELARLNRLLLEDAFPKGLSGRLLA